MNNNQGGGAAGAGGGNNNNNNNNNPLAAMENVLTQCLSTDKQQRSMAAAAVEQQFGSQPLQIVVSLIQVLAQSRNMQARHLAAVLLRKRLPVGEQTLIESFDDNSRKQILQQLLQCVINEQNNMMKRQIADCAAEVANVMLHKNKWPEFLPFVAQCCNHSTPDMRKIGFFIFGKLSVAVLEQHMNAIRSLYVQGLADKALNVRIAAVGAVAQMLSELLDIELVQQFQPQLPTMLDILKQAIGSGQYADALSIINGMCDIAADYAVFFRPRLEQIGDMLRRVAVSPDMPDDLRRSCMEFFCVVSQSSEGMVRKTPTFYQHALVVALTLMMDVQVDSEWPNTVDDPDGLQEETNYDCGELALDRLALSLGGRIIMPVLGPMLQKFFARQEWKCHYVALMAVAQVGEFLPLSKLPLDRILQSADHQNMYVRYASVHCIGQLSTDFAPQLQSGYTDAVVPVLMRRLSDKVPRIQSHSGAALFNFAEHATAQQMHKYTPALLQSMMQLLQHGVLIVKSQMITTIAVFSACCTEQFTAIYDQMMGVVKNIIANATSKEHQTLRARSVEAATFIGMSVGSDLFRKDAADIMRLFLDIMNNQKLAEDDITLQYINHAWSRICGVLGAEFVPVLQHIMPRVLETAGRPIKMRYDADPSGMSQSLHFDQQLFTAGMEEKMSACSMLLNFAHDLRGHFIDWVVPTMKVMLPLVDYHLHDDVKAFAISIMPDLVHSAVLGVKNGRAQANLVTQVYREAVMALITAMKKEVVPETLLSYVQAVKQSIVYAGQHSVQSLTAAHLDAITETMLFLLQKSNARVAQREEEKLSPDFDEIQSEKLEMANNVEDDQIYYVADCVGTLIKTHGRAFLPSFDKLVPQLLKLLAQSSTKMSRKFAVFVFDDLVEYLKEASVQYFSRFLPALIQYTVDVKNPDLRQASAYGLGVCAQFCQQGFARFAQRSAANLLQCITMPKARDPENASATDNALAALGKLCVYSAQSLGNNAAMVCSQWLANLPMLQDPTEGPATYNLLLDAVSKQHPVILGPNNANVPRILSVCLEELHRYNPNSEYGLIDADARNKMVRFVVQIGNAPANARQQIVSKLSPDHRQAFDKMMQSFNQQNKNNNNNNNNNS
eukprot:TRINITY_DN66079_c7_g2_i3.p1 TRINITY_DN66079_c7_g2~~TRINITY_DN66079_c7_g2_i3.p1  ORF type:complete len:1144 (+),score=626.30 TRINITY_DN66079_c7_g2_i3:69-3434(+)